MEKGQRMSWEAYFMSTAFLSSFRSKDSKTPNGSCVIDTDKRIIGIGYNGLTHGCDDNDPRFWNDEDDSDIEHSKHTYVVHAERNAIYNAFGRNLKGSHIYATLFPCANCAQTIVQSGIKRVVYLNIKPHHASENRAVRHMFEAAGIECVAFRELDIPDASMIDALNTLKLEQYPKDEV